MQELNPGNTILKQEETDGRTYGIRRRHRKMAALKNSQSRK